jgi:hypothetical protein
MSYPGIDAAGASRRSALALTGLPLVVSLWVAAGIALALADGVLSLGGRLLPQSATDPLRAALARYRRPSGRHRR